MCRFLGRLRVVSSRNSDEMGIEVDRTMYARENVAKVDRNP